MNSQLRILPPDEGPDLHALSDEDLVKRCQRELPDQVEAYRELVRRYEGLVYNFCLKTIGSPQDAEEIAQDSLIQVFHKINQFQGRSAFKTWLYKIVHNYCRNRISKIMRKRKLEEAYEEHVKDEESPMDQGSPESLDQKSRIESALKLLKPKDREIITYKFMLGMTLQEISDTLDIGSSAAKMRYYRAMESFKAAYDKADKPQPTPIISNP